MKENKIGKGIDKKAIEVSLKEKYESTMKAIEQKTGIKGYIVLSALALSIIFVSFNIFENVITNLVGTVYPAFCTMRCIQIRGDEKIKWLTYWVIFASFSIIDMFSPIIMKLVPFYFVAKILFLIWLLLPNSNGAHLIYHIFVKRVFTSFESDIDFATGTMMDVATQLVVESSDTSAILDGYKKVKKFFATPTDLNGETKKRISRDDENIRNKKIGLDENALKKYTSEGNLKKTN